MVGAGCFYQVVSSRLSLCFRKANLFLMFHLYLYSLKDPCMVHILPTFGWLNLMVNVDPMGHAYMFIIGKQISM